MARHLTAALEKQEGGHLLDVVSSHDTLCLITLVAVEPAEGANRWGLRM
jgi:hypothetical protein